MLPSGGYFKKFLCPDAKTGCDRPYCQFGGHSADSVNCEDSSFYSITNPVLSSSTNGDSIPVSIVQNGMIEVEQEDNVPSYSTVPTEHFQGYQGYFAASSPPPASAASKRGLLPTPATVSSSIRPARPTGHQNQQNRFHRGVHHQQHNRNLQLKIPAPPAATESRQPNAPQKEGNLNVLARDLAAINNEIERLQKKLHTSADSVESEDEGGMDNKIDHATAAGDDGYDPEMPTAKRIRYEGSRDHESTNSSDEQYQPTPATSSSSSSKSSAYRPTPIGQLKKLGVKSNKLLKDTWAAAETVSLPKKVKAVGKTVRSKSAALLEKKREVPKLSGPAASVADLFGDDSDSEADSRSFAANRQKVAAKKTSARKSKDEPDDMASMIDDFIAPTASAPYQHREIKKEFSTASDDIPTIKKKRVVEHSESSVEATKKLRESGGQRSKGNLLTPREQLESRFAQLKKAEEELKLKQRHLNDELKKQEAVGHSSKQTVNGKTKSIPAASASSEIATHPKGEKRIARLPKSASLGSSESAVATHSSQRPTVPVEIGGKVPSKVRQQYLNLMVDEYLKALSESEAYQKAVEEERAVFFKATSKQGYVNAVACSIKKIRDGFSIPTITDVEQATKRLLSGISHTAVLGGKGAAKHTYTISRSGSAAATADRQLLTKMLSGEPLYEALLPFVLTIDQQCSNGYPRPDLLNHGGAVYYKEEIKKMYVDDDDSKRVCVRCGQFYHLTPDGKYARQDECFFHWGRAWKKRVPGSGMELRYNCCQGDINSPGCSLSQYHVSDRMPQSALNGYVYTSDWSSGEQSSSFRAAYALDCEMIYTTGGNELARVTIVNDRSEVVYERCVRPENMILDYNTRFSGLTEEILRNEATTTLEDVQRDLASIINSETILIGHSLESDFRALKLIHNKVIDTSIVFPHRLGAPYKRALRNLATEFLKKFIQDDSDGHDSKEDATTCMELMRWRLKQDSGRGK